jgi:hypothetical protein
VYFAATGVLTNDASPSGSVAVAGQPNVYLYQRDQAYPGGRIEFIGVAAVNDTGLRSNGGGTFVDGVYPVPAVGVGAGGDRVGGDGRVLVFQSFAAFTADDADGGKLDVFRYDSDSDEIERVSKAEPGGSDNGPFDVATRRVTGTRVGTDVAEIGRWVSEDANTIVMRTAEGLAAGDTNGVQDTYMWRDGRLYPLPGSSDDTTVEGLAPFRQPAISHDGSVVAYVATAQVLPQDGDSVADVYVARVNGGYEVPDPVVPCDALADACHGGGAGGAGVETRTGGRSDGNAAVAGRVRVAVAVLSGVQRRRAARRGVLALRVRADGADRVRAVARGRVGGRLRRLGAASKGVPDTGVVTLRVRLAKPARERLGKGRRLRLVVEVSADGGRSRSVTVLLRRTGR